MLVSWRNSWMAWSSVPNAIPPVNTFTYFAYYKSFDYFIFKTWQLWVNPTRIFSHIPSLPAFLPCVDFYSLVIFQSLTMTIVSTFQITSVVLLGNRSVSRILYLYYPYSVVMRKNELFRCLVLSAKSVHLTEQQVTRTTKNLVSVILQRRSVVSMTDISGLCNHS